ncbi:MAG TPA: alpha/beta hydrolase, partial [Myxococcota bacterium]
MSDGMLALVVVAIVVAVVVAVAVIAACVWFTIVTVATLLRRGHDGSWAPGLWRAGYDELWAGVQIAAWGLDRRRAIVASRMNPEAARGASVVVVLVHGAGVDGSSMRGWAEAIVEAGVEAPIFSPDHGRIVSPLIVHATRLNAFLRQVIDVAPDAGLLLFGHSMGGIVIRRALADDDEVRARVIGAVTVASPHLGTAVARWTLVERLLQLSPGHQTVMSLPPLSSLVPRARTFGSPLDVIVYPYENTIQDGVVGESIAGHGHAALLTNPTVAR